MNYRQSLVPDDDANRSLIQNVHPAGWNNPEPDGRYNMVVVGGGTAGLITAAVAASLGAKTALIERGFLGGDCLNVGCVPSKGLIRGARAAEELEWIATESLTGANEALLRSDTSSIAPDGARFLRGSTIDFGAVMARMRTIRASISNHDSAFRYSEEFGIDVCIGHGRFTGRDAITVTGDDGAEQKLRFHRAVIATGARAAAPPIPGLEEIRYLTNETLFSLTELPQQLAIIGAGPIGCEMAQSFARLGSTVELFEMAPRVLPREDPDVSTLIQRALESAGVIVQTGVTVEAVAPDPNPDLGAIRYAPVAQQPGEDAPDSIPVASSRTSKPVRVLVAIGRAPNLDDLGLEAAGVTHHPRGIEVNAYLQTHNRRIYAAGDIAIPYQFTHMAELSATVAVQNALFMRTKKLATDAVPWCTYTSPEVAHVGLTKEQARATGVVFQAFTHPMASVDRARLDGDTEGFVTLLIGKKGRILGATIVAAHAGEMIGEIVLAMQNNLGVGALSAVVHPYPTQAEAVKRAASSYLKQKLTPRVQTILKWWFRRRA